jgi:hypothetical protein
MLPTIKRTLAGLALGLAIAASASPSFARTADKGNSDSARDAAIHDCSMQASKWSNTMWQTGQFHAYSNCMMEHGQRP